MEIPAAFYRSLDMAYVKVSKGIEKKTTSLSKFLRILRIEHDELLANMAEKLGIMPSYLSSIEANRRDLTPALQAKLIEAYHLNEKQQKDLCSYVAEAAAMVKVDLESLRDESNFAEYVDTALLFARDLSKLGSRELGQIRSLLESFSLEGNTNEKRNIPKSKNSAGKGV